ncbi:MAG TPA: DUF6585 family protein [Ktedonobacteraceae bacterium]|nr:DUF6585 family protein [Ktedonobacteraceae bacterium]
MINTQAQQELQISQEIYNLVATHQLGIPTAEYRTGVAFKIWLSLFCFFLAIIALLLALLAFLNISLLPARYTPLHALVVGVLLLSYGLYLSFRAFPLRTARAYVCPGGLLLIKGSKPQVIRWDAVVAMWHRNDVYGYIYDTHVFIVRLANKQTFKFDGNWRNLMSLGEIIANETAQLLLPQAMAAYYAGQPVAFGDLKLSLQGISGRRRTLPWQQIKNIDIGEKIVTIEAVGEGASPWARFHVSGMSNFLVFEKMLESVWTGQHLQQQWGS